jgi:tetratricopeptide (TPR) repeat protein
LSIRNRLFGAVLLVVSAQAQDSLTANIRRTVHTGVDVPVQGYFVQLSNLSTRVTIDRIEVASDGGFYARYVPYGDYVVRVTTFHGDTLTQQFITINQHGAPIELRLPGPARSPTGKTVSVRELRNPPRRQALDAAAAAQRFADSGKFDRAAAELEKAVRISPEFAPAHSGLAVQYLRLARYEAAEAEIRRAMELAGPTAIDLSNLAYAHLAMERFGEAAENARAALKLRRDLPAAHFVLGMALVLEPETRGEGVTHLQEAAKTLESARRTLAALGR